VVLFLYFQIVAWTVVLVLRPTLGNAIFGLVASTVIPVGIGVWAELGSRQVWFVVGERSIKFGRVRPFSAAEVVSFAPMSGKREIKALRKRLRGDADIFNASRRPHLKGLLAPPGVEDAVLVRLKPGTVAGDLFLIGTHHQAELLAALHEATGLEAGESLPPQSSLAPGREVRV
jgi:hypothetical protein